MGRERIEGWLEAERDQLVLWVPVLFGAGIAAWFALPDRGQWTGLLLATGAVALFGLMPGGGGRAARALTIGALAVALGCGIAWWRAEQVAAPVLARPAIPEFRAKVERVEELPARGLVRLRLAPLGAPGLPPRLRVNLDQGDVPAGLAPGAIIRLRARLMPPSPPSVPGAYDFARVAWFQGLGATGRGFAPVTVETPASSPGRDLRARLSRHIQGQAPGGGGAIAAALATGDEGGIPEADAEAMRRSGLAHLLSVSGLHLTAVTGGAMWIALRILALFPGLALRWRLPLVAAGIGAGAAIGYTWLTGAQVPTIRSCIAALMVLLALSLGREAVTLRLVAAGALAVLLLWPEALVGPSFQLSFAAVTAIVALHESPRVRGWFQPREESRARRFARALASLLLTGVVVELALMPIALFHFHRAGLYGALANIVAIPLTTFIVMPAEALALLLDTVGLGAPIWWVTARALDLLLWIAHTTAALPGAVQSLPAMPGGAFALMAAGGLWLALWRTRARLLGLLPLLLGALWAAVTPAPDLLVTGDGRHLALRMANGGIALLRDRAGDYTRATLAENLGFDEDPTALDEAREARCSADTCLVRVTAGGRAWRILATRSPYPVPIRALLPLCRASDIIVSDRRLPRGCTPRWLRLDRPTLARTGGVAITFATGHVTTVAGPAGAHPWVAPPRTPLPDRLRFSYRRADGGGT